MPESSRAFLSRPRTMHDEIRTGRPYGHALSIRHRRKAHTKTTSSFQNLEAALPPGIPAGRRSSSPQGPLHAGIGDHWFNSGGEWTVRMEGSRIVFPPWKKRSREVWMQSEPRWPRIIMGTPLRKQSNERSVPTHPSESKATRGVSPHRRPRGEEGAQWCGAPAVDRRVAGDSFRRTGLNLHVGPNEAFSSTASDWDNLFTKRSVTGV